MPDALDLLNALQSVDLKAIAEETLVGKEQVIADMNRMQLLRGLDSDGNYLSPKYSEDPYFKSRESALRYAKWKASIDQATDKPFDVPNLFINGRFHNSLKVEINQDELNFSSNDMNSLSIESKFGDDKIYGLNDDSKDELVEGYLRPLWQKDYTSLTGLKFN